MTGREGELEGLKVTTAVNATPALHARAAAVAARCGCPVVLRRGPVPEGLVYVVARDGEWVVADGGKLRVDAGLLHAKLVGDHPLIRAVGPASRVFDGTLGLAGDALHLAGALGAEVVASEASPAVFSLTEAGLKGLAGGRWAEIAALVRAMPGQAADVLAGEGTFDVVFLAPMFEVPARAAPGYEVFRRLAVHQPLDARTLTAARRAAPRVVIRVEKGGPPPEPEGWTSIRGGAVDYWQWTSPAGTGHLVAGG